MIVFFGIGILVGQFDDCVEVVVCVVYQVDFVVGFVDDGVGECEVQVDVVGVVVVRVFEVGEGFEYVVQLVFGDVGVVVGDDD